MPRKSKETLAAEAAEAADAAEAAKKAADAPDATAAIPSLGFPLRVIVTNNTRMPVQVPSVGLDLPASGEAQVILYNEGGLKTLQSDLNAVFSLNGFGEEPFTIRPAEKTEA